MKRIDVLKGIEQILVRKAYETGHISHRADGDWQKQADGSWIPYKGQSNQSAPQTQEPATNNENVKMSPKQLTRHLLKNGDYDSAIRQIDFEEDEDGIPFTYDDNFELIVDNVMNDMGMSNEERKVNRDAVSEAIMDRALQLRKPTENKKDPDSSYEKMKYGEITEEDLNAPTPSKNKLSKEEKAGINNKLYDVLSFYDSDSKELFGVKRTDGGEIDGSPSISYDWKTDKILPADKDKFDKIVRHYMDKADIEDTPSNYKQAYNTIKGMAINNGMLNRTNHPLDTVNKSYRDMRSTPTTKNMGF